MEKSDEPKTYYVTGIAGTFVAGVRSPGEGKPIRLNSAQAETPLRNGEISETRETKPKSKGA